MKRALLIGVALLTLAVVMVTGVRARTMARSDTACTDSCHTPHDDSWPTAVGHTDQSCQSCHLVSNAAALDLALSSVLGGSPSRHGELGPCESCHDGQDEPFALAEHTSGHRAHDGETSCATCHHQHEGSEASAQCRSCHAGDVLHAGVSRDDSLHDRLLRDGAAAEDCTNCHAFGARGDIARTSTVTTCGTCHAKQGAASIAPDDLHGAVDCSRCHSPHPAKVAAETDRSVAGECGACHEVHVATEKAGPAGHRRCEGCHQPHAPKTEAALSCDQCHREQSAWRAAALAPAVARQPDVPGAGAGVDEPPDAAGQDSDRREHDDCHSCHKPHVWTAARAGCVTCHDDVSDVLIAKAPKQHGTCKNCHAPHGPPPTSTVCVSCHDDQRAALRAAPAAHACRSCHEPHGGVAQVQDCASCHRAVDNALAAGPSKHAAAGCRGCHQPHGNPAASQARCSSCHELQAVAVQAVREPSEHSRCGSCHDAHGFAIETPGQTCARCHETPMQLGGSHRDTCDTCHVAHGPPDVLQARCTTCHADVHVFPAIAHNDCGGCHVPHKPARDAPGRCATCHERQIGVAQSWPVSVHRDSCTGCHEGHDVREPKACSSCHIGEARSAAADQKHRCQSCHAPHETPADDWWSRCQNCHGEIAAAVVERGPTHGRCASCHSSHGVEREPPTCMSCHTDIRKSAAHARTEHHTDCGSCHDTHERAPIDRGTCLACHEAQRDHQPEAPRCYACHLFK